ncbi:hypothetical protein [Bacillus arachidis]|uniref:hypothetical protein n=1 Tax=Bacillus arachidis TaxID=2819290 RepID=UPI001FB7EC79|nr:hypothetical protein [Bacillus arachidis]
MASKAKGLSNKIGDLWNKGKTKVKNDFLEADKAFRYAMKKLGEYVPKFSGGPTPVMEGAGKIPSGGKNLLKDAYQYVKDTGERVFGSGGSKKTNVDDFNAETATAKQKGNFGEIKSGDNLLNNQSIKDAGYDLKVIGRDLPSTIDDKIVKGIDGLYENTNAGSKIKYVIDESKFGSSQLGKTKDGPQMSNDWLTGSETRKSRILKAVDGDKRLADKITKALEDDEVERVLSKVDTSGNVKTYRIDAKGDIIGEWP